PARPAGRHRILHEVERRPPHGAVGRGGPLQLIELFHQGARWFREGAGHHPVRCGLSLRIFRPGLLRTLFAHNDQGSGGTDSSPSNSSGYRFGSPWRTQRSFTSFFSSIIRASRPTATVLKRVSSSTCSRMATSACLRSEMSTNVATTPAM